MSDKVQEIITEKILEALDAGVVPWRKTWKGGGLPLSYATKKPYRGVNAFLLSIVSHLEGYQSRYFLTYNQAKKLGGQVRKGEHGFPVVFWKWLEKEDAEGNKKKFPLMRYYRVFNFDQVDGLAAPDAPVRDHNPVEAAEEIVQGYPNPPAILHQGGQPCYVPSKDEVQVPVPEAFESGEAYYAALFHELTHSTGHKDRLDRLEPNSNVAAYSKEELVAEMGAAFLCGEAGVEVQLENTAAYLDGWRKRLSEDKALVIRAAAQAQKAVDHVLDRSHKGADNA